jgi:prophage antirepressor-like protein
LNQLEKVFNYGQNTVRTIVGEEEIWFVARDVCDILAIKNTTQAVQKLDEDERSMLNIGRQGETNVVNEYGLFSLVLSSRKPEAKTFKRWITHEVLPTIRKTGGYVANEEMFVQTYLPTADDHTKALFKVTLETVRKLNEEKAVLQPKADYFDALVDRNLLTNFRDTAKELKIKQGELIDWLLINKYLYRDQKGKLKPYAPFVPSLFELKDWSRNGKVDVQTLITPKGKETFRILLQQTQKA